MKDKPQHRFRILWNYHRKKIDATEAMSLLGVPERTLGQLHTLWQDYLPAVVPIIDRLMAQTNTKREQAKLKKAFADAVGITYRQVNRLLKTSKIDVPAPISSEIRKKKRSEAQNRRRLREKYALDVISGLSDVPNAAERAEVTERHIYRLVNRLSLLAGVPYKDLRYVTPAKRAEVTANIEQILGE